jgi:type VI secretion system lysozyme-like protein
MYKGSLFERLSSSFDDKQFDSKEEALYASIANNLSRIFSTNAGSAEISKDYGKVDLNNINLSMNDSIEFIEKSSENTIKRFEPRLYKTKVGILRENLNFNEMTILIQGYLVVNGRSKKVRFNDYYKKELNSLRLEGSEFSKKNPGLSTYLSKEGQDPDVERLLEGFSFLTGRLKQQLDYELPEVSHTLVQLLWPNYIRPIPSYSIIKYESINLEQLMNLL